MFKLYLAAIGWALRPQLTSSRHPGHAPGLKKAPQIAFWEIDVGFNPRNMPEQIERMMLPVRGALWTYAFIGVFGLILASVGLAGATAYSVTQRFREIGIRVALGARSADVLGLVMREGAVLVGMGTIIGFAGAWAGIRLLSAIMSKISRTAGTSASDPALLAGAPLLLAGLALLACYVPARRSLRIDPVVALHQE